jgi:hypothetical protein
MLSSTAGPGAGNATAQRHLFHPRLPHPPTIPQGPASTPAQARQGTGLQGMADRLAAAGGALRVNSAPGLGTTVSGRLPVSELAVIGR